MPGAMTMHTEQKKFLLRKMFPFLPAQVHGHQILFRCQNLAQRLEFLRRQAVREERVVGAVATRPCAPGVLSNAR
jgi:hypothetical protein